MGLSVRSEIARWAARITSGCFYIADTETTGFSGKDQVIQLHIIDQSGETVFDSLFACDIPIGEKATEVNGITDDMLVDKPEFEKLYHLIATALHICPDAPVLWYNSSFDLRLMKQTAYRAALRVDDSSDLREPPIATTLMRNWNKEGLFIDHLESRSQCVMNAYAKFKGTLRKNGGYAWHSLTAACYNEDVPVEAAHTAGGDCQMTLRLLQRMAAAHNA